MNATPDMPRPGRNEGAGTGPAGTGPARNEGDGADEVDRIVDQWRRERPDLDVRAMGTLSRFARLWLLGSRAVEDVLARYGLRQGEFDVLAALRRSGGPCALSPSALSDTLMLSRAGMTNRIDRLAAAGLVRREPDPADRRSFRVALTGAGRDTIDAAVTEHTANESRLLAPLSRSEQDTLDLLLRRLLASFATGGHRRT
ncbi:transcriptional regulator [Actinocatenispora thailandica]|uniref:Transcriptional regulator n=1 Tax=Actinocatenispora thailandica TaxID=227318 RepID=A0A7R7HX01_9ACTN|nr:MarR family transcriptional regulator [Actinocatenispora thailandica]BCJ35433.1 transcriptional regulator [Actinocatenispora thailandica]